MLWFRNYFVIWRNEKNSCCSSLCKNARKLHVSFIVHKKYKLVGMAQTSFYASRLILFNYQRREFHQKPWFFSEQNCLLSIIMLKKLHLPTPAEYWKLHCVQRAAKSLRTNSRKMRNKQINNNNVEQRNMDLISMTFFRLIERLNTTDDYN